MLKGSVAINVTSNTKYAFHIGLEIPVQGVINLGLHEYLGFEPPAIAQMETANMAHSVVLGSQPPLIIFTTAMYRSIAIPTRVKLLARIAKVVKNGTALHIAEPKIWT